MFNFIYFFNKIIIKIKKKNKKKNIYEKNLSINFVNDFNEINFKRININKTIELAGKS